MKRRLFTLFLLTRALISEAQTTDSLVDLITQTTISTLNGAEEHRVFLESVFQLDQSIRNDVSNVALNYGSHGSEYDSIFITWRRTDRFLLEKMVDYLEEHPHPTYELGEIACKTPQLIFHHASGTNDEIELKLKHLPIFYNAFQRDDISDDTIWFYLYRLYEQVTGVEIQFSPDVDNTSQIEMMYSTLMKN